MLLPDESDDKVPIKYCIIGNSATNKIITEFNTDSSNVKRKKEINQIFKKLCKSPNKKLDERNKIVSENVNYYFTFCKDDILYIIAANNQYPERFIFELIAKSNEQQIPTKINDDTKELNPEGRQELKRLIESYQDPKSFNKIAEIQNSVDMLKVDMKKNINKMVSSLDDVNNLQDKSNALKMETEDYKKNSVELRKITGWQNVKLWIILGGIVLVIVVIIIICNVTGD